MLHWYFGESTEVDIMANIMLLRLPSIGKAYFYRVASSPIHLLSIRIETYLIGSIHYVHINLSCDDFLHIFTLRTVISH